MNSKCETIIFSDRAYNAIIRESFSKHPLETGGKLLGYISADGKIWFVMEALSAGVNATHQIAHFQYDKAFIDYLSTSIANQYQASLQDLGLWHRHPGSMDTFSSTDDITNVEHASRNPYGIISGLVNIDPKFRLTLYYLNHQRIDTAQRVLYSKVTDILVGDAYIPKEFFALRYVDPEDIELHPLPPAGMQPIHQKQNQYNVDEFSDEVKGAGKSLSWQSKLLSYKKYIIISISVVLFIVLFVAGYYLIDYVKSQDAGKQEKQEQNMDKKGNKTEKDTPNLLYRAWEWVFNRENKDKND